MVYWILQFGRSGIRWTRVATVECKVPRLSMVATPFPFLPLLHSYEVPYSITFYMYTCTYKHIQAYTDMPSHVMCYLHLSHALFTRTYPSTEWGSLLPLLGHQPGGVQLFWTPCSLLDLSLPPQEAHSMFLSPLDWNLANACVHFDTSGIHRLSSHLYSQWNISV